MRAAIYEREQAEKIIEHCVRTGGSGSIQVLSYRAPFLGNYIGGKKRHAAEESLYILPEEDPFFGYGELAQLAYQIDTPEAPLELTDKEAIVWMRSQYATIKIWLADTIQATIGMHLFRATAHHIEVLEASYGAFHSEKWRLRRGNRLRKETAARLSLIYVSRLYNEVGYSIGVKCGPMVMPEIKLHSPIDTE